MNLIFICSYLNVTDVIDTIEHENDDFMIFTADKGLEKLFSNLYSSAHVTKLPNIFESLRPSWKLFLDIVSLNKHKKTFLNIGKTLKPSKIIFYYIGANAFESWLIKKMSNDSYVYHRPKVNMRKLKPYKSLRFQFYKFFYNIFYGLRFSSKSLNGFPSMVINQRFLTLVNSKYYNHNFDEKNIVKFLERKFDNLGQPQVMLLIGGHYHIEDNEYINVMEEIYSKLLHYYKPCNIAVKNHPNFPVIKGSWCKDTLVYDDFLSASLLCYNVDTVIGYVSSVLFEAAEIGKNAISTAYMIQSIKIGHADEQVDYLTKTLGSKDIIFPRNIDEFMTHLIVEK